MPEVGDTPAVLTPGSLEPFPRTYWPGCGRSHDARTSGQISTE